MAAVLLGVWAVAATLAALALWVYAASLRREQLQEQQVLDTALEGLKRVTQREEAVAEGLLALRDSMDLLIEHWDARSAERIARSAYTWLRSSAGGWPNVGLEQYIDARTPESLARGYAAWYTAKQKREREHARRN